MGQTVDDPEEIALEHARENINRYRRFANSDLPIAEYAQNVVDRVEAEYNDV